LVAGMGDSFVAPGGGAASRGGAARATPWTFEEAREYARSFGFGSEEEYLEYRCPGAYALPRDPTSVFAEQWCGWDDFLGLERMTQVLFVETGFGVDGHGQDATKAAVRAARNAIEFNSIPCIENVVPGGYEGLRLNIDLAIPQKYHETLDWTQVHKVFPYGKILSSNLQEGGAIFHSGIAISALGDKSDDMIVAICAVTVGY